MKRKWDIERIKCMLRDSNGRGYWGGWDTENIGSEKCAPMKLAVHCMIVIQSWKNYLWGKTNVLWATSLPLCSNKIK